MGAGTNVLQTGSVTIWFKGTVHVRHSLRSFYTQGIIFRHLDFEVDWYTSWRNTSAVFSFLFL